VAGKGVDGYMDAGIEAGGEDTVGAGVDVSSDWEMEQQIEAFARPR
jgi:hypothetical protein